MPPKHKARVRVSPGVHISIMKIKVREVHEATYEIDDNLSTVEQALNLITGNAIRPKALGFVGLARGFYALVELNEESSSWSYELSRKTSSLEWVKVD